MRLLHVQQHGSRGLPLTLQTTIPLGGLQLLWGTINETKRTKVGPVTTVRYQPFVLVRGSKNRTASDGGGVTSAN